MKFTQIIFALNLIRIMDSKLYRIAVEDKILPYVDSSISPITDYFSLDNFILEQIDDDNVQIGGYLEVVKSMDRNLPMIMNLRTQFFQKATWAEAAYRLTLPNICSELINPSQIWYNVTKLWTSDVCPGQIGDKWEVEPSQLNIIHDVPSSVPIIPMRGYVMISQGLPGFEKMKFGYGIQFQMMPLN